MDWANEPWVKLYTRPTPEVLCWPWQSRVLLDELLKVIDRAGRIGLGRSGIEGLCRAVHLPPEVVEPGLAGLLEDGCVMQSGQLFTVRNFVDAQEARTSGKLRAKEFRDGRKYLEKLDTPVTQRNTPKRNVTDRNDQIRLEETRRDQNRVKDSPPAPPSEPSGVKLPRPSHQVLLEYVKTTGQPAVFESADYALVERALGAGFSREQLELVGRGVLADPWPERRAQMGIRQVFSTADQIRKFIALAERGIRPKNGIYEPSSQNRPKLKPGEARREEL